MYAYRPTPHPGPIQPSTLFCEPRVRAVRQAAMTRPRLVCWAARPASKGAASKAGLITGSARLGWSGERLYLRGPREQSRAGREACHAQMPNLNHAAWALGA